MAEFFLRSLIAGVGVALVAGPFGCVIVWRRMAYFGDTLAHAALLGVALAMLLEIQPVFAVFVVASGVAIALASLRGRSTLSSDALLGLLSHGALALGLVTLSFQTSIRFDMMGLLFGDILAVSWDDIAIVFGGGVLALAGLAWIWRSVFAATVNWDLAAAEGLRPERANLIFTILMAGVIAMAMKVVGVLLITALLIVPAAAARRFTLSPESMAVAASTIGIMAVVGGLYGSLIWDSPSGPSIVVAAFVLFLVSLTPIAALIRRLVSGQGTHQEISR